MQSTDLVFYELPCRCIVLLACGARTVRHYRIVHKHPTCSDTAPTPGFHCWRVPPDHLTESARIPIADIVTANLEMGVR